MAKRISLWTSIFERLFVFITTTAAKPGSHKYEVSNGMKIKGASLDTKGFSAKDSIQKSVSDLSSFHFKKSKELMKLNVNQSVKQGLLPAIFLCSMIYYISFLRIINKKQQSKLQVLPKPDQIYLAATKLYQNRRERLWNDVVAMLENQKKTTHLPKIIAIGMEHCGIDALVDLLLPHPSVRLNRDNGSVTFYNLRNDAHLHEYTENLPEIEEDAFLIEKKSGGFYLPPYNLPYFMKKMFPSTKLLLLLCEPTKRVLDDFIQEWTAYNISKGNPSMEKYESIEMYLDEYIPLIKREIGDYRSDWSEIDAEHKLFEMLSLQKRHNLTSILTKSFYALHLKRWISHFDESNMMVIDDKELYNNPGLIVEKIQDFARMPKLLLQKDYVRNSSTNVYCYKSWNNDVLDGTHCLSSNNTNTDTTLSHQNQTFSNLKLLYASHNEGLYRMLGKRFDW